MMTNEELKKKLQDDEDKEFMNSVSRICRRLEILHRRGFETKEGLMALILMELNDMNFSLDEECGISASLSMLAGCVSDRNTFCTSTDVTGEIGTY